MLSLCFSTDGWSLETLFIHQGEGVSKLIPHEFGVRGRVKVSDTQRKRFVLNQKTVISVIKKPR